MYTSFKSAFLPVLLATLILLPYSFTLDIESAKERPCFEVKNAVPSSFTTPVETWYSPLMSRLDLYEAASMLLGKDPKDILENELYYDGCITWKITSPETVVAFGFGGKSKESIMKAAGDKAEFYDMNGSEPELVCVSTMTDNKTFIFSACCMKGNQMTWSVGSSIPELPKETVKKIHEHAESLGFKREYFTGLSYKTCEPTKHADAETDNCNADGDCE